MLELPLGLVLEVVLVVVGVVFGVGWMALLLQRLVVGSSSQIHFNEHNLHICLNFNVTILLPWRHNCCYTVLKMSKVVRHVNMGVWVFFTLFTSFLLSKHLIKTSLAM